MKEPKYKKCNQLHCKQKFKKMFDYFQSQNLYFELSLNSRKLFFEFQKSCLLISGFCVLVNSIGHNEIEPCLIRFPLFDLVETAGVKDSGRGRGICGRVVEQVSML